MNHVYMRQMPDLRQHSAGITLEHCSVLLEKIGKALGMIDGGDQYDASQIDPTILLDYYNDLFEPEQFARLFSTELGKGILVGVYVHWTLTRAEAEGTYEP